MKTSNKKRSKVTRKVRPPVSSKKELEARQKAEEFWSDPCWQQPLDHHTR